MSIVMLRNLACRTVCVLHVLYMTRATVVEVGTMRIWRTARTAESLAWGNMASMMRNFFIIVLSTIFLLCGCMNACGFSVLFLSSYSIFTSTVISDERAQQLIDEALQKGSLKQRDVVSTVTGLTGSGKTWLLSRLFGKDPPDLYTSTGIAEKSERGLFFKHFLGNKSFKLLAHKDILEFLAPLIQAGMTEADLSSLAAALLALDPFSSNLPLSEFDSLPEESSTCQEMVGLVQKADSSKKEMVLDLIHMIDTGGQPEFMERMPCLIHNANLAVLVVNLLYNLDEHPPIRFHVKGVAYKNEMPSQYSTRQMIRKLAATLQAKRSSHKRGNLFQILVVATHRDCVKCDLETRVDALNQELRDSLLPTYQDKLITYSADQIPFVLNLKDPDDKDKEALEIIRSKVSDKAHALGKVIDIPGSLFIYEQDLLKYAAKKERGVLSLKECLDVGAGLKMEGEVVQAALVFFHRNNTFLYFREVLPNLVFVKPQVPLDFVNAVVHFSYKVRGGEIGGLTVKTVESLKKGIITEEILSCEEMQSKEFSTCFVPGLYELRQAIELSCHTFTLAPLSCKKWSEPSTKSPSPITVSDCKKDQYLMMCLLPPIPDEKLCQYIPSSSNMVPLVVKFTDDCVPLGCFGSIISCLLSNNWKVSEKDNLPECLYHDIALLFCLTIHRKIVLVDTANHIEVHVSKTANCDDIFELREEIFEAVKKVFDIMHITDPVSPAVLCPCKEVDQPHTASLGKVHSKKYLLCSESEWKEEPEDRYTIWFGDKPSQTGKFRFICSSIRWY